MHTILAFRTDRFGETLLIVPALKFLKRAFPGSSLVLVTSPEVEELARTWGIADTVLAWDHSHKGWPGLLKFAGTLRGFDPQMSVAFNPSKELHLLSFLSGARVRAGYSRKWPLLLTRRIPDLKHLGEKHEFCYNLDLAAAAAGIRITTQDTDPKTLTIPVNSAIIKKLSALPLPAGNGPLIALHPWTSDPVKQWPAERFQRLATMLAERDGCRIAVVGKEDPRKSEMFFSTLGKNAVNLTGKTTLPELAGLLSRCRMLISADSGPVHMASAVGTPSLVLFRNDLPGKTAVRWGPLAPGSLVLEKSSLMDIRVDEAYTAARRLARGE